MIDSQLLWFICASPISLEKIMPLLHAEVDPKQLFFFTDSVALRTRLQELCPGVHIVLILGEGCSPVRELNVAGALVADGFVGDLLLVTENECTGLETIAGKAGVQKVLPYAAVGDWVRQRKLSACTRELAVCDAPSVCEKSKNIQGTVIGIFSAQGGVGKSAIGALLSHAMAQKGVNCAFLDADYQFGGGALYLADVERRGDAVVDGKFNADALRRSCIHLDSGPFVYGPALRPEHAEILEKSVSSQIKALTHIHEVVIVDTSTGFNEYQASVAELSQKCLIITARGARAGVCAAGLCDLASRIGIPRGKLRPIQNKADPRRRDEDFSLRLALELELSGIDRLHDGGEEVSVFCESGHIGSLLTIESKFAVNVAELADDLLQELGINVAANVDVHGYATQVDQGNGGLFSALSAFAKKRGW